MMVSQSINSQGFEDSFSQAQAELLEALLEPSDALYPWNPADPSAEAYFENLEQQFQLDDWSDEEIMHRSRSLFAQLDSCWTQASSPTADVLEASLSDRFAARVPSDLLGAIARIAKQVVKTNLSKADQLVQCVQQMLPNWAEEDLLVFARPFAYAMRGEGEAVDSTLSAIRPVDWTDLSQMEQARLSMAIASYALDSLHKASEDS
ncbi:MAG TPA: hypothetical protein V6D12_17460 [Candidatus Obscuribacterales bacterium]